MSSEGAKQRQISEPSGNCQTWKHPTTILSTRSMLASPPSSNYTPTTHITGPLKQAKENHQNALQFSSLFFSLSTPHLLDSFQKVDSNIFFCQLNICFRKRKALWNSPLCHSLCNLFNDCFRNEGQISGCQGLEEWCRRDEWQQKGSSRCWSILPVVDTCTHTSDKLFGITYTIHMRYKTGKIRVKLKIYINNLMVTYCDLTDTGGSWSRCTRTYYFLQLYVSLDVWINFSLKIKNIQIKMRKHLGIQ